MKVNFNTRPKRFNEVAQGLITVSNHILTEYARQGYDLSLRQLYYQLVSRNVLPNRVESYNLLGKVINDGRMAGLVDWSMIVDRGRLMQKPTLWSTPGRAVKAMARGFMLNKWTNQPFYVEVMVEKQALEGVIQPVCSSFGIGFTANKGYTSASALYNASLRFNKAYARGKEVVVLYLGDHDPSGVDMTRDLRDRLAIFCRREVDVKRLALNRSQIDQHNLPPNPAKMTDSRAGEYVGKHGDSSWELDALPPQVLARLVIKAVERRLDRVQWEADLGREKAAQHLLQEAARALDTAHGKLAGPKITKIQEDEDDENVQEDDENDADPTESAAGGETEAPNHETSNNGTDADDGGGNPGNDSGVGPNPS